MQDKFERLIYIAKHKMKNSNDPIHDLGHVSRVVNYTKLFIRDTNLSHTQKQSLILAAWWHDVARTVTKNPSFIWMPLVDDTISAIMLWISTVRCGLFGAHVGIAMRIILCKSFGTRAIFTRILFKKRNRILADILGDADTVDMLYQERAKAMMGLAETSKFYLFGYRAIIWWSLKTAELHVKTEKARECLVEMLKMFINWVKEGAIYEWHVQQFGAKWVTKTIKQVENLLQHVISPKYKSVKICV